MSAATPSSDKGDARLSPFLSPLGAWSYGVGTAIGWGSLVVTTNSYLLKAGPLGSVTGMVVGTIVMLFIAVSYAFLMNRYPDSGGSYTYTRHVLGNDCGFLCAWFLVLAYASVLWANATSLPLFSRFFIGDTFKVGYLYTVFDYDVYLGEVLLTMGAIALVGLLCTRDKRIKERIMIVLALIFTAGITICFGAGILGMMNAPDTMHPLVRNDTPVLGQILDVALMTPWAFVGFESISHSTEEFAFERRRSKRIIITIVITTALLYIFIMLLSASAYPSRYTTWFAYLSDLGNLSGIEALPAFYAAQASMGPMGLNILMAALLALVLTSLIGNIVALSRLFVTLSRDTLLPESFSKLNSKGTPQNAVLAITGVSLFIPLLGRTAIGWIVDITTIATVIVYGLIGMSAYNAARAEGRKLEMFSGAAGAFCVFAIGAITIVPNLFTASGAAPETYFLITVWSIVGFLVFRLILHRDETDSFGNSAIVWLALLSLVLFSATVWMQQTDRIATENAITEMHSYFEGHSYYQSLNEESFISLQLTELNAANVRSTLIAVAMFVVALLMMVTNYSYMLKRQRKSERALHNAQEVAYSDPLTGVKSKAAFVEWETQKDEEIHDDVAGPFSVVVCDVNGLKFVNDTLGHAAGDAYIKQAATIVCHTFKHSPVFRIGGDEFVAVLQGEDHEHREELLTEFNRIVEGNIGTDKAVISAGISVYRDEDFSFHSVFERADARMYQRKMQLKGMGAATRD